MDAPSSTLGVRQPAKVTAAEPSLVCARGVEKTYRLGEQTVRALDGVDFEIQSGEFVAIMGPSGSGKSTFMNILGCLDLPSSGEYRLADEMVAHHSRDDLAQIRNRRIGFVFQQFNLLARTSALENVALPLLYSGASAAERTARATASLQAVGLGDRLKHTPTQLSGGQQQRVAIARALVNNPDLLLADEPTGALDSTTSIEVMALFQELHARGQTVVIVTHEPGVAVFAQRVVSFLDGRIQSDQYQTAQPASVVPPTHSRDNSTGR